MKKFAIIILATLISGCAMRSPMEASLTGDGKYWVLTNDLVYENPDTGYVVNVPRGFVTDLASVPRLFWSAFPPCGIYTPSAVVHDYLYWEQPASCDRKCADDILLIAMKEAGVSFATRQSIYAGVRVGGQGSWDDNTALRESGKIRNIPDKYMCLSAYETWPQIENRIENGIINACN